MVRAPQAPLARVSGQEAASCTPGCSQNQILVRSWWEDWRKVEWARILRLWSSWRWQEEREGSGCNSAWNQFPLFGCLRLKPFTNESKWLKCSWDPWSSCQPHLQEGISDQGEIVVSKEKSYLTQILASLLAFSFLVLCVEIYHTMKGFLSMHEAA